MSDRLPTHLLVTALLRRANDAGGFAAVRSRGDATGGGVLVLIVDRDGPMRAFERGPGMDGETALIETTPCGDIEEYWQRRVKNDPDLWVIELDGADSQRLAVETLLTG